MRETRFGLWLLILMIMVVALAACGGDEGSGSDQQAVDTLVPFEPSPLPPTWTPTPPGYRPSPTATRTPTLDSDAGGELLGAGEMTATQTTTRTPTDVPGTSAADGNGTTTTDGGTESSSGSAGGSTGGESGQLGSGQAFPPTWTPGPQPTNPPSSSQGDQGDQGNQGGQGDQSGSSASPGSSNRPTRLPPAPTWTPQPQYCYQLESLMADVHIVVGESVTINWAPIPEITYYRLEVKHPGGFRIFQEITTETTYTLPAELFNQAVAYGWEVHPLTDTWEPICFPVSGEIIVSFF